MESSNQDRFLIQFRYYNGGHNESDYFQYSHGNDLWLLRHILIHNKNFEKHMFSISGIDIGSTQLYAIPAIYDNPI